MSSLVEELQRDVLDSKISASDLLRKSLVIATKLNLGEFRTWVEQELSGYADTKQIPEYRRIVGRIMAFNPMRGYIPAVIPDAKLVELLSTRNEIAPVGVLESLLSSGETSFACDFAPDILLTLLRMQRFPMVPQVLIPRTSFAGILDAVRNAVLTWSLKLETDGIVGEGMSFSPKEKKLASEKAADLQPVVNYIMIEHMENSSIQQGTRQSRQRRTR
jgi:hypothetical protein